MTKDAVSFKRESCAERVQWVASWLDFANSSAVPRYRGDFFGSGGSMAQGKERADELVFAQGLAESREMAKRLDEGKLILDMETEVSFTTANVDEFIEEQIQELCGTLKPMEETLGADTAQKTADEFADRMRRQPWRV